MTRISGAGASVWKSHFTQGLDDVLPGGEFDRELRAVLESSSSDKRVNWTWLTAVCRIRGQERISCQLSGEGVHRGRECQYELLGCGGADGILAVNGRQGWDTPKALCR